MDCEQVECAAMKQLEGFPQLAALGGAAVVLAGMLLWPTLRPPPVRGITVLLPHSYKCVETDCDGRPIWIELLPNGRATVNGMPLRSVDVAASVESVMDTRQERVVYFTADPQVSYSDAVKAVDSLRARTEHLAVMMVTPTQMRELFHVDGFGISGDPTAWIR